MLPCARPKRLGDQLAWRSGWKTCWSRQGYPSSPHSAGKSQEQNLCRGYRSWHRNSPNGEAVMFDHLRVGIAANDNGCIAREQAA